MDAPCPQAYLRNAVLTASPEQLQLMLYDGAIRFAMQARDAVQARDYEQSYQKLSRAQAIVLEMQNGLRPEVNPELCQRMASLYMFIYRKLVDASVKRDVACIDEALDILKYQRETWVMLMEKVGRIRADSDPDPGVARAPVAAGEIGAALCVDG